MGLMARGDLMDRLEAVLPHADTTETAHRVVEAMARICRATTAAAYRERGGMLRWIAGDHLPGGALAAVKTALRARRGASRGPIRNAAMATDTGRGASWVYWSGRPHDAELDVVYFDGTRLRDHAECGPRLARLMALLGELA